MGNSSTKKEDYSQVHLKGVEIYSGSHKSAESLYSKETHTKGYYIHDNCHYIAIYDGHGHYGGAAAYDAHDMLLKYFEENKSHLINLSKTENIRTFILKGFQRIQERLGKEAIYFRSGTCCIGVLILNSKLYVINVGNSRAVLAVENEFGLKSIKLSQEHDLTFPEERDRIIKQGLRIKKINQGIEGIGAERIWIDKEGPGVTVTRTLGNWQTSNALIHEPTIREYELNYSDSFLILGSDGLWDVITSEEAVEIVGNKKRGLSVAEELANEAKNRWLRKSKEAKYMVGDDPMDIGKTDDITTIICYFDFPTLEDNELLERFEFLFENKHARLKELKNSFRM